MSQQYNNEGKGVLFKNDRKEQDNHPDYRGQINVDGQDYWLSAWLRKSDKGTFMSLSVKPKEEQAKPQAKQPARQQQRREDSFSDDIPF